MGTVIAFFLGLLIGGFFGVMCIALVSAGHRDDD